MPPLLALAGLVAAALALDDRGRRRADGRRGRPVASRQRNPDQRERVFYRVTLSDPPARSDFTLRPGEAGLSAFSSIGPARRLARWRQRRRGLGTLYVAELRIPEGAAISITKTGGSGHYEPLASPDVIRACYTRTAAVVQP